MSRQRHPGFAGKYVLDLFGGSGGVARAARREGAAAWSWDIADGDQFDLTTATAQRRLRQEIQGDKVLSGMLGPPCSSFGPAGNRRKPLRSQAEPWGRTDISLNDKEQARVDKGNELLQASFNIIKILHKRKVPWIFEHPHSSYAFQTEAMKAWLLDPSVHARVLDQCQYGTRWRKRTRLVLGNVDELDSLRLGHGCRGSGGWCSSGRKHVILQGSSGHGDKTAAAAAYPRRLCTALVQTLLASARAKRYNTAPYTLNADGWGEGDGFLKGLGRPLPGRSRREDDRAHA